MKKQHWTLTSIIFISLLLQGCISSSVLPKEKEYSERFSNLYQSQDGQHLIFISPEHHYIFDSDPVLAQSLNSPMAHYLKILNSSHVHIDAQRQLHGKFVVTLKHTAPDEIRAQAIDRGFNPYTFYYRTELSGMRYDSNGLEAEQLGNGHDLSFRIQFTQEPAKAERVARWIASPLAVLADGVVVVVSTPILLAIPIGLIYLSYSNSFSWF